MRETGERRPVLKGIRARTPVSLFQDRVLDVCTPPWWAAVHHQEDLRHTDHDELFRVNFSPSVLVNVSDQTKERRREMEASGRARSSGGDHERDHVKTAASESRKKIRRSEPRELPT